MVMIVFVSDEFKRNAFEYNEKEDWFITGEGSDNNSK